VRKINSSKSNSSDSSLDDSPDNVAIKIDGVSKSFKARSEIRERYKDRNLIIKFFKKMMDKQRKQILDNVSLQVHEGEIVGVMGPNGAGKTTLMKICTGLMDPDKGKVEVLGHDVSKEPHRMRKRIDGIFARANLYRHLSTEDNLKFFSKIYRVEDYEEKIDRHLKKLEIEDRRNAYVDRLSTGERTKAKLIKAFLTNAEVLFLDEPTSGLDPAIAINIRDYIQELKSRGITILMCTHSMREAEYLCDEVIMMNKGKVVQSGKTEEMKKEIGKENVVEYQLDSLDPDSLDKLDQLEKFGNVRNMIEEQKLRVILDDPEDRERIREKIEEIEIPVKDTKMKEPTLEDVFIHLTGRELT